MRESIVRVLILCSAFLIWFSPIVEGQVDTFSLQYQSDTLVVSDRSLSNQFRLKNNSIYVSKEAKELSATFDDPSRVLYRHPGISTANDQANGIIYHGMPSDLVKWSIHGAEIVNPNHLSNAGTSSDLSSPSSGGVLAIPFDVINNFSFNANANTDNLPSAISGVSNFDFKAKSNNFFKIGLLGLEYALQTNKKRPTKMHLRYSTVGLLSKLGLDFGGEEIVFTDIFFQSQISSKLDFISGIGYSSNTPIEGYIPEGPFTIRNLQEVDYNSFLAYAGFVYTGKNRKQTIMYSQKDEGRNCASSFGSDCPNLSTDNIRISYAGQFNLFSLDNYHFDFLMNASVLKTKVKFMNFQSGNQYNYGFEGYDAILLPTFRYRWYNNKYSLKVKLGPMVDFREGNIGMEPSLIFIRQFPKSSIELSASSNSQAQDPIQIASTLSLAWKRNRVNNVTLTYRKELGDKIKLLSKVFYHHYSSGVVGQLGSSPFFNGNDFNYLLGTAHPFGEGRNYGLELFYDHELGEDFYFNSNVTFFDFTYTDGFDNYDAANNYKFIFNASLTKTFNFKKNRNLTTNFAFHYRGGANQYLFHRDFNFISPDIENPQVFKLADYYRLDARIQYSFKKSILSLDIQNVTNHKNEAFYFYDSLNQETSLQYQLGLIPVLSWKRMLNK